MEKNNNLQSYSEKPARLPQKFWDDENKRVKLDEFIEDYISLATRDDNLVETNLRFVPESYEGYEISINNNFFERDDEVLKKLHEFGFTNKQAQLVYDLAEEKILPILGDLTIDFEAQKQLDKLVSHFGSKEKFDAVARQISAWAKQNISPELYDVLGATYEGVVTLYKMMSSNEPPISGISTPKGEEISETTLKEMMKDPRYWRDKDTSYIDKISKGFEKLYSGAEE